MPRPTRKQLQAPARCRTCDRELGRLRGETGMGPYECCCRIGYCMRCCTGEETDE